MIHHVSYEVSDLERAARFYDAVLGALGWRRHIDGDEVIGWGIVRPVFYVSTRRAPAPGGGHVCFEASGIPAVKGAWQRGVEAGGSDDGAPAQRPERGPTYYAGYLLDPDGNRVEVTVTSG